MLILMGEMEGFLTVKGERITLSGFPLKPSRSVVKGYSGAVGETFPVLQHLVLPLLRAEGNVREEHG